MAPQSSALSKTLESLTLSKIRELEKQRSTYEDRKAKVLADAESQPDLFLRVNVILNGTKAILPHVSKEHTVTNIERWLDQRCFDPTVTDGMLKEYETELRSRMDAHSRRLSLADLYSRLLTEWTNASGAGEDADIAEDEYLVVDERQKQRLEQLCDQFEEAVFTPFETSTEDIHAFFDSLFPDDEKMKQWNILRNEIFKSTQDEFEEEAPFDEETLTATIGGLLREDIVSEEKQDVLKGFLKNSVALTEIADVLNMRWADLENWDWFAGDEGIPVLPRQELNGKYRIWIDEDVLQLIFVQYIGIRLCNILKSELKGFIEDYGVWNWKVAPAMTEDDVERLAYYTNRPRAEYGPEETRKSNYTERYFLSKLPTLLTTLADGDAEYDDDDSDESAEPKRNIKQELLRKVATETLLQRRIYGEAAVIQTDLRWFGTSIPHSTIFAVMSYIGFPEKWIAFFRKYFAAPLNMDQSSTGRTPKGPQTRQRGMPMAHASEKLIGELVLFFMDFAVNSRTGMLLYRLHDDIWLCGEPSKCAKAWEVMGRFAEVTGLEFNDNKTGSVYLSDSIDPAVANKLPKGPVTFGFLELDNSGTWVIDQKQVGAHVKQLKRQLDKCDSVMAWIRTWNSCIGRFFRNTFGEPAACFGQQHVDMILATYRAMQETLFGSTTGTVAQHLRQMIKERFGVSEIPDALFYYPEELGGLALRNPAISPFLVRRSLKMSPLEQVEAFLEREREAYNKLKKQFHEMSHTARMSRFTKANNGNERQFVSPEEKDTFISFEEWSRFRWSHSAPFRSLYDDLQRAPVADGIRFTSPVTNALRAVLRGSIVDDFDEETKWLVQMYAPEVLKNYGGVDLVEKKYLPVGVMAMVKEKRVRWQMVL
ncbi:hypothetical protein ASPVEDRAFT_142329 [Aspergillus versicolor CBS 583.65]|uniref:Reverse transcriptase domain-containing protein n=1 Tax=Aspergillus versicolor CBS 583.65 TaxID=1036611 RepID=A0A1L9Q1E1_ASPVE|nr:uncharacterized protein ASPVEDRAFT_142329 [Aspergillus versicolor CBS 583.65]OJJ07536.1 hypothetical protein ASPVEDRAFT_142329 [Aspergillus versicolor CBS 583.65]